MKISAAVLLAMASAQDRAAERKDYRALSKNKQRSFKPDRFIYEWPMCATVETCVQEFDGCDGKIVDGASEPTGKIEHRAYTDRWNCRWEIKAAPGHTVGLKFWSDFDLEWHGSCGFDRLHIRCLDTASTMVSPLNKANTGAGLVRLCGPKQSSSPYPKDALTNFPKGTFFKQNDDTGCKHLSIEMNTDQDLGGETERDGFTLGWSLYPHDNTNSDPCKSITATVMSVSECIAQESIRVAGEEYQRQIDAASGRKLKTLLRVKDKRLTNVVKHVHHYMARMLATISRCGQGLSVALSESLVGMVSDSAQRPPNDDAEVWFKIWNTFATSALTGEAVTCKWYVSSGDDETMDQSSFPCRTRRVFKKMQGKTQNGNVYFCEAGDFDTFDL